MADAKADERETWTEPRRVVDEVWRLLAAGVDDRRSPHHTPTLISLDPDGRPRGRTVVLREANAARRRLLCHCRSDAPKVKALRLNPSVCWHSYDPAGKTQLTLDGEAMIHPFGDLADARWQATSEGARACYRRLPRPGSEVDDPSVPAEERGDGRDRFAVIEATITRLEWLWLHHAGHRRLRAEWTGQAWHGGWVAP